MTHYYLQKLSGECRPQTPPPSHRDLRQLSSLVSKRGYVWARISDSALTVADRMMPCKRLVDSLAMRLGARRLWSGVESIMLSKRCDCLVGGGGVFVGAWSPGRWCHTSKYRRHKQRLSAVRRARRRPLDDSDATTWQDNNSVHVQYNYSNAMNQVLKPERCRWQIQMGRWTGDLSPSSLTYWKLCICKFDHMDNDWYFRALLLVGRPIARPLQCFWLYIFRSQIQILL